MNKRSHRYAEQASPDITKHVLVGLLLATSAPLVFAAPPPVPDAGSILQQVQPVTPPPAPSNATGLTIEQESGTPLPQTAPFLVQSIQIVGNTIFDTPTLHALVAAAEGQNLTLIQLHELVARITRYYQANGYPLARAIIPQQLIRSGSVRIEIIEARYGKILLENRSRVNDSLLQSTLASLQPGQAISQGSLDHALLLISDVPGTAVNAVLKPGEAVGTSDLTVDTTPLPSVVGNVAVDNYGNSVTGRARLGGTVELIDPLHHGDTLSLGGVTSGSDMDYAHLAYDSVLNGGGTRAGVSYSSLYYRLGDPLSSLDAHGTAEVESLWVKHPLVRRANVNLYGQIEYDRLQLDDHLDISETKTDRHLDNGTMSLIGDARDAMLTGGVTTWNANFTSGQVGFDNQAARLADAATVRTEGHYSKWNLGLNRLQNISPMNTLYLAFSGQWANSNLDSSQKVLAGGPFSVRAYDVGALSGDTGYQETAEFRHNMGIAWLGRLQTIAFIDSAQLTIEESPLVAGKNTATLSGVGVGLNWVGPHLWSANTYVAARIGSTPVLVQDPTSVRAWVSLSKGF